MEAVRAYIRERIAIEDRGYSSPCWIWQLGLNHDGYGDCTYLKRHWRAHRLAYVTFVGEIAEGLQLDHLCRVRSCCNPTHLEQVTCAENVRRSHRGGARGRMICKQGLHAMVAGNLSNFGRRCLACKREADRKHYFNRKKWKRAAARNFRGSAGVNHNERRPQGTQQTNKQFQTHYSTSTKPVLDRTAAQ